MVNNSKETGESVERIPGVGVTMPMTIPVSQGKPLNLVVHGLEQAGPSYEVRVFIGNKSADIETPLHSQYGFVGTIPIYGYGPSVPENHTRGSRQKSTVADVSRTDPSGGIGKNDIRQASYPAYIDTRSFWQGYIGGGRFYR